MKKSILSIVFILFMCLTSVPVFAADYETSPRLMDNDDLLTDAEEAVLSDRLNSVSEEYQVDILILTEYSLKGFSPREYANSYYDLNQYGLGEGRDGVMLLISMEERDWYILTNGLGHVAVTDEEIEDIGEKIVPSLSDGDYATAFHGFIDEVEYQIDGEINGFPFAFGKNLLISFIIGLVVALIVTGIMRGQLKSVKRQPAATEYIKPGSMQVTMSNDLFLYRTIDRRRKEKTSSSSGGGSSRGGGGGKF